MKTNLRLMAVTLTLLCASLAGCFGGDDSDTGEYSGPIDLIVYYESTSGMVETSENNGQAGPTTGVELSFDFADTTSDGGSITKIIIEPDDGSDPVEGDPSDDAVISYTWMTHGVFEVTLTAEDSEGDSHSIMVKVKIDMHIVWSEGSGPDASMSFDVTSDSSDGLPLPDRITLSSTADNQGGLGPFGGANSDVTLIRELSLMVETKLGIIHPEILLKDFGRSMWMLQKTVMMSVLTMSFTLHMQKALKTLSTHVQSESKVKVNCIYAVAHL